MSSLRTYLNKSHQNPEKVESDFKSSFGVNVKKEGEIYLFKYGITDAKWDDVTKECRGSILRFDDNDGWNFLSRPFDKFFNQHEGHCPVFEKNDFDNVLPDSALAEKADGTCIQLWHDGNKWRVSTLGTIVTHNVYDSKLTFEELFLKTVSKIYWNQLDTNITYIFELCAEDNRIVTQYPSDHAVLLGARDRTLGSYLKDTELEYEIYAGAFTVSNIRLPQMIHPKKEGINSLEDVHLFVEEASKTEKYGKWPEGFVLYDWKHFHPIAKIKNAQYKSLHSFGGGDIKHSRKQVIDAVFLGHIDDVYDVLNKSLKSLADELKVKATKISENMVSVVEGMKEKEFPTRKAYAAYLQDHCDKRIHSFFFVNANQFMKKDFDGSSEKFDVWLKKNYKKFDFEATA